MCEPHVQHGTRSAALSPLATPQRAQQKSTAASPLATSRPRPNLTGITAEAFRQRPIMSGLSARFFLRANSTSSRPAHRGGLRTRDAAQPTRLAEVRCDRRLIPEAFPQANPAPRQERPSRRARSVALGRVRFGHSEADFPGFPALLPMPRRFANDLCDPRLAPFFCARDFRIRHRTEQHTASKRLVSNSILQTGQTCLQHFMRLPSCPETQQR